VFHDGVVYEIADLSPSRARTRTGAGGGSLTAPMPATVVDVKVKAGDAVKRGDIVIVLEAMKMELPVRALGDGKVTAVHCRPGELVQPDTVLIEIV
jgi:biotin carboxyl carrier protein